MVSRDDGFSWVAPRCTFSAFANDLYTLGNPELMGRATAFWNSFQTQHVEPLFGLAIFWCESNYASNAQAINVRYGNHNPGNLRNPPPEAEQVETDRGTFLTFPDWESGFDAMAVHLGSDLYKGLTVSDAIYKWAPPSDHNDPEAYISRLLDKMNALADNVSVGKGAGKMRVIVSAGHENIGQLVGNDGGFLGGDAERLSHGTGAAGEEQLNAATADALVDLLSKAGVDAVRTDALYHADVYGSHADLCIFIHADGVTNPDAPQHAGCVPVRTGTTSDADTAAQRWCDTYKAAAPAITGIQDENLDTADMDFYYGGHFPTADTPQVLVETCIVGAGNGIVRDDALQPGVAAHALALATAQFGGLNGSSSDPGSNGNDPGSGNSGGDVGGPSSDADRDGKYVDNGSNGFTVWYSATNHSIGGGFANYYRDHGYTNEQRATFDNGEPSGVGYIFGYPLTQEFALPRYRAIDQPVTVQIFERAGMMRVIDSVDQDGTVHDHVELMLVGADYLNTLRLAGLAPADAWVR